MLQDALSIIQNGGSSITICKILQYHITWKGISLSVADAMQNESSRLHNAGWRCSMLKISHISRAILFLFCFVPFRFRPSCFRSFLSSWLCKALESRVSWLHGFGGIHRNQNHKHKEITNTAYTQTKTTPSAVVGVFLQLHQPRTSRQQPTLCK